MRYLGTLIIVLQLWSFSFEEENFDVMINKANFLRRIIETGRSQNKSTIDTLIPSAKFWNVRRKGELKESYGIEQDMQVSKSRVADIQKRIAEYGKAVEEFEEELAEPVEEEENSEDESAEYERDVNESDKEPAEPEKKVEEIEKGEDEPEKKEDEPENEGDESEKGEEESEKGEEESKKGGKESEKAEEKPEEIEEEPKEGKEEAEEGEKDSEEGEEESEKREGESENKMVEPQKESAGFEKKVEESENEVDESQKVLAELRKGEEKTEKEKEGSEKKEEESEKKVEETEKKVEETEKKVEGTEKKVEESEKELKKGEEEPEEEKEESEKEIEESKTTTEKNLKNDNTTEKSGGKEGITELVKLYSIDETATKTHNTSTFDEKVTGNKGKNPVEVANKKKGPKPTKDLVNIQILNHPKIEDLSEIVLTRVNSTDLPVNKITPHGANDSETPAVLAKIIKTTVTKLSVPLNGNFIQTDWYRGVMQNFLSQNNVSENINEMKKSYGDTEMDGNIILQYLYSASTFRDNILNTFEFLLTTQQLLTLDQYSALEQILNVIRLKRVPLINSLAKVAIHSLESYHKQFIVFFKTLKSEVPKYMESSITFWLECLNSKKIDIDDIVKKNPWKINLLRRIYIPALQPGTVKFVFLDSTINSTPKESLEILGEPLAFIVTRLFNKSITLSPQFFGGIIANLPINKLSPEADENLRYLVEVFRDDKTYLFQKTTENLKLDEIKTIYDLAKQVLAALFEVNYYNRKHVIQTVLFGMEPIDPYHSHLKDILRMITNPQVFCLKNLLNNIIGGEYPREVIRAKAVIIKYLDEKKVDESVLHEFVKVSYSEPRDMLLAALSRIVVRYNSQNLEIISNLERVKEGILLKKSLEYLKMVITVEDTITLLSSLQRLIEEPEIRKLGCEIKVLLHKEKRKIQPKLQGFRISDCASPKKCATDVLKFLNVKEFIENENLKKNIEKFLYLIDSSKNTTTKKFSAPHKSGIVYC